MRVNDEGRTVAAIDVLAPGTGEIICGSMAERGTDREHCAPTLPSPASGGGSGRGRSAPLRHGAARPFGVAPAFARGRPRLRHQRLERARRDPLPANHRQRAV